MSFNSGDLVTSIMNRVDTEILTELEGDQKTSVLNSMENIVTVIVEEILSHISTNGEVSVSEAPGGSTLSPPGIGTIS